MAGKSRRYDMAPAHISVFVSHESSNKSGIIRPAVLFSVVVLLFGNGDPSMHRLQVEHSVVVGVGTGLELTVSTRAVFTRELCS